MATEPQDGSSTIITRISAPPAPLPCSTIGQYDVIYPLAQGGMASVHVGRKIGQNGFENLVAIKVVHQHLMNERSFLDMFLDEARLAALIKHPNVIETFSIGEENGLYYMVSELVLGQDLRSVMRRAKSLSSPLSFGLVAHVASLVCWGLHAAHEVRGPDGELLGLVHRDVSPRNVLVSYDGRVKLIDFGVAWAKGKLSHTRSGAIKGKVSYMPPEQLRGLPLDRRSDIYSLGVALYALSVGVHPFPGATSAERMARIVEGKFSMPRKARPEIPAELERIILKAMSYSASNRFDTAEIMGRELEAFAQSTMEDVGAGALAALMNDLFSTERARHEELLRSHCQERENREHERSKRVPSRAPGEVLPSEHDEILVATPHEIATTGLERRRSLIAVAFVLSALAALAAMLVFIASIRRDGSAEPAAHETNFLDSSGDSLDEPTDLLDTGSSQRLVYITIVGSPPADVRFSVDGRPAPLVDGGIYVPADDAEHVLDIEADGYLKRSMLFVAKENLQVDAELRPIRRLPKKEIKRRDSSAKPAILPKEKGGLRRNPYQ
jgi:serine/threonine-protein kinase